MSGKAENRLRETIVLQQQHESGYHWSTTIKCLSCISCIAQSRALQIQSLPSFPQIGYFIFLSPYTADRKMKFSENNVKSNYTSTFASIVRRGGGNKAFADLTVSSPFSKFWQQHRLKKTLHLYRWKAYQKCITKFSTLIVLHFCFKLAKKIPLLQKKMWIPF